MIRETGVSGSFIGRTPPSGRWYEGEGVVGVFALSHAAAFSKVAPLCPALPMSSMPAPAVESATNRLLKKPIRGLF